MTTPAAWTVDAACATVGHEAFYPEEDQSAPLLYERARRICNQCPAKAACLEEAMVYENGGRDRRYGMWGGTTPRERALLATGWVRAS